MSNVLQPVMLNLDVGQHMAAKQQYEAEKATPIPDANYSFYIEKVETSSTKNGGARANIQLVVTEGPLQGKRVFHGVNVQNDSPKAVAIAQQELAMYAYALGWSHLQCAEQLVGQYVDGKTKTEKGTDGYDDKSAIKDIAPYGSLPKSAVMPQNGMPGPGAQPQFAQHQQPQQAPQQAPQVNNQYQPGPSQAPQGGYQQQQPQQQYQQPQQPAPVQQPAQTYQQQPQPQQYQQQQPPVQQPQQYQQQQQPQQAPQQYQQQPQQYQQQPQQPQQPMNGYQQPQQYAAAGPAPAAQYEQPQQQNQQPQQGQQYQQQMPQQGYQQPQQQMPTQNSAPAPAGQPYANGAGMPQGGGSAPWTGPSQ